MLYCTYDQYAAAGGTVPEAAFGVLCSRASRMIDAATFGRAESHAAGCEACREALADACGQIVGLLAIMHDRLYQACTYYSQQGWINASGLKNLEYLYQSYHALGGNGTGTELYNRAKALPIRD